MFLSESTVWPYRYRRGSSPLIVSMPHAGTFIPRGIGRELGDCAAGRPDTDWHLPRLYDFLDELDATVIVANYSRYVVDMNRPPDGSNLYPGRDTPRLCPVETFDGRPLYRSAAPDDAEIARRIEQVWRPYHRRIANEIARVKAAHGLAVLWDAHSIASEVPKLFEGRLPDLNVGTAQGRSCDPWLQSGLEAVLQRQKRYTSVLNGRFTGGYITRHFGRPADRVHAVQLEMAECTYMDERAPYGFRTDLANHIRPVLRELLETALAWASSERAPRNTPRAA